MHSTWRLLANAGPRFRLVRNACGGFPSEKRQPSESALSTFCLRPCRSIAWSLCLCCAAAGCSRGPQPVPVQGVVTSGGQPLTEGVVMFYPAQGRPATGTIEADGSYRLTTHAPGDGAVPGDYVVTVEAVQVIEAAPPPKSLSEEIAGGAAAEKARRSQVRWLAPEEYADRSTTPLKATVLDQENRLDFALP